MLLDRLNRGRRGVCVSRRVGLLRATRRVVGQGRARHRVGSRSGLLRPKHLVGRVGLAGKGELRLRCRCLRRRTGKKTLVVLLGRRSWRFLVLVLVSVGAGDCLGDDAVGLFCTACVSLMCSVRVTASSLTGAGAVALPVASTRLCRKTRSVGIVLAAEPATSTARQLPRILVVFLS